MILVLIIDFVLYKLAFFPLLLQIALSSTGGGNNRIQGGSIKDVQRINWQPALGRFNPDNRKL
jgi:hypothetical protein